MKGGMDMTWFDSIYLFFVNLFNSIGTFFYENTPRFIFSLQYMWKGMLGIFIVIGVIIISVYIMGYLTAKAEERKSAKEKNEE